MAALLREAGYGVDETVLVGLRLPGIGELYVAQGDLTRDSIVYALLIQRGVLDLDSAPTDWLPGMPDWARAVRACRRMPPWKTVSWAIDRPNGCSRRTCGRSAVAGLRAWASVRAGAIASIATAAAGTR